MNTLLLSTSNFKDSKLFKWIEILSFYFQQGASVQLAFFTTLIANFTSSMKLLISKTIMTNFDNYTQISDILNFYPHVWVKI